MTAALTLSMSAQQIITVDNNATAGAMYTSVQEAVDAASAGDYIYVHPSPDPYGDVTINKTIHLRGLGHNPALNAGEHAVFNEFKLSASGGAPNTSISGVEFYSIKYLGSVNADYSGFQIINCRITGWVSVNANFVDDWLLQGNVFVGNTYDMINQQDHLNWVFVNNVFQNAATDWSWNTFKNLNSSTVFRNNIIMCNQSNNPEVYLFNNSEGLVAENCIFLMGSVNAITISGSNFGVSFENCMTYNYGGGVMTELGGSDNLNNVDPMFINNTDSWFSYDDDLSLSLDSEAAGYGTDGEDLGVYGNGIAFSMEGYPIDLPYPTDMVISSTSVNSGATLEVEFKAKGN